MKRDPMQSYMAAYDAALDALENRETVGDPRSAEDVLVTVLTEFHKHGWEMTTKAEPDPHV
jgi:hypothetical protein